MNKSFVFLRGGECQWLQSDPHTGEKINKKWENERQNIFLTKNGVDRTVGCTYLGHDVVRWSRAILPDVRDFTQALLKRPVGPLDVCDAQAFRLKLEKLVQIFEKL